MYIAISGNIGSGKTTLTQLLAKHYGWKAHYEQVANNPYLDDYYRDIRRWSFNTEVFFLKERFRDLLAINRSEKPIIQDRSIFEGVYIFAANNKDMGNISDRDFDTYMGLFDSMMMVARMPDLMIYLRASVSHLVDNVQQRGRSYEQNMSIDYLTRLNERYENFIHHQYKGRVLTIEVDDLDFKNSREDLAQVIRKVDRCLEDICQQPNLFNNNETK